MLHDRICAAKENDTFFGFIHAFRNGVHKWMANKEWTNEKEIGNLADAASICAYHQIRQILTKWQWHEKKKKKTTQQQQQKKMCAYRTAFDRKANFRSLSMHSVFELVLWTNVQFHIVHKWLPYGVKRNDILYSTLLQSARYALRFLFYVPSPPSSSSPQYASTLFISFQVSNNCANEFWN